MCHVSYDSPVTDRGILKHPPPSPPKRPFNTNLERFCQLTYSLDVCVDDPALFVEKPEAGQQLEDELLDDREL